MFGPILFGALLVIVWRCWRRGEWPGHVRLLLSFSLPIIAIVTAQAFISRAHANWAAPAYVAATVLVIAELLERQARQARCARRFVIHAVVLAVLAAGVATAGQLRVPFGPDPLARTLGWREVGAATRGQARGGAAARHAVRRRDHRRARADGGTALLHARRARRRCWPGAIPRRSRRTTTS